MRAARRILIVAVLTIAVTACARRPAVGARVDDGGALVAAEGDAAASVDAVRVLEGAEQIELAVDGGAPLGVVAVPVGARAPRPIMIALHGGSDHPEWACAAWRGITSAYPFVVCPRGVGATNALAWSGPADTRARVDRAVAATRARFGDWVRPTTTLVLVGFSMGATQTALLAQSEPKRYPRVTLAESAYAPEPALAFAAPWARGGGERAIFLCTTDGCEATYRNAARNVAAQRSRARLVIAGTHAHGMWDQVVRAMRRDWPWLVEGAEGWNEYVAPTEDFPGRSESY
ncbi:MAG: hypothetical protein KIT84_28380 [Labilithrix sp.]|nr:hypothetical protein [Labilithrix sp.]MCW5814977.1 hypothetical protein [Labilithrix sp.]